MQTCYRHPDRRAGVVCQRCDKPICPDCMNQASVGFHCPDCARSGAQKVLRPRDLHAKPVIVYTLIALNVAIFLWDMASARHLIVDGGLLGDDVYANVGSVSEGEWWRIFTSGFLHDDGFVFHVLFNCLLLYQLGIMLEPLLGRVRFLLLYTCALIGGSFGVLLLSPDQLTIGASGAVFGLMGATLAVYRSRGIGIFDTGLGGLIVINLIFTFTVPNISVGGHIGGLAAGFLAGWVLTDAGPRLTPNAKLPAAAIALLSVAMFAGCLLVV